MMLDKKINFVNNIKDIDKYMMFRCPTQSYAVNFCKIAGLEIGKRYYIIEQNKSNNFIKISSENEDRIVELSKSFFQYHFKKDMRTINLKYLLK